MTELIQKGVKEMYDVNIRAINPITIGSKTYEMNESILKFDKVEFSQIGENIKSVQAKGGYGNSPLINWDFTDSISFGVTHGMLSEQSLAILSNSKLDINDKYSIPYCEKLNVEEYDDYGAVDLKFIPNLCPIKFGLQENPNNEPMPMGRRPELSLKPLPPSKTKYLFVYDNRTKEKIPFNIKGNRVFVPCGTREVIVDYTFDYNDNFYVLDIGRRLQNAFVRVEGKISVKNKENGIVTTGLLDFPKVKLSSSLRIKLGKEYTDCSVSDFYMECFHGEGGRREDSVVGKVFFLNNELSGDYI